MPSLSCLPQKKNALKCYPKFALTLPSFRSTFVALFVFFCVSVFHVFSINHLSFTPSYTSYTHLLALSFPPLPVLLFLPFRINKGQHNPTFCPTLPYLLSLLWNCWDFRQRVHVDLTAVAKRNSNARPKSLGFRQNLTFTQNCVKHSFTGG